MFRPHKPVKLLGYTIQGIVPKRRSELARSIGQVVERELISADDLVEAVKSEEILKKITDTAVVSIRAKIMDRLPVFIPLSIKKVISDIIADQVRKEIPSLMAELLDRFGAAARESISFHSLVEDRINSFSLERLEQIIFSVSARELKHIEMLGGVLGFLIGVVQACLLYLLSS